MGGLGHLPGALSHPPSERLSGLRQSSGGADRDGGGELNVSLLILMTSSINWAAVSVAKYWNMKKMIQ